MGSTQVMMKVWRKNWSGTTMLTSERQWQIQLLEMEEQAWAFEGRQRDVIGLPFPLELARRGSAAAAAAS